MTIKLDPKDYSELMEIIKLEDKVDLSITHNSLFNTVWLLSEDETELYLKSGHKKDLIISRIAFTNCRCGIGTKVLDWLIKHAKEKGFEGITIESVCSTAMYDFCKKHSFKPIEHTIFPLGSVLYGNYYLSII